MVCLCLAGREANREEKGAAKRSLIHVCLHFYIPSLSGIDPFYLQILYIPDLNVQQSTSYSIGIQSITKPLLIYPPWPRSHSSGTTFRGARRGNKESWSQAYTAAEGGRQTNKIGHTNADARQSEYISESVSVTPALKLGDHFSPFHWNSKGTYKSWKRID